MYVYYQYCGPMCSFLVFLYIYQIIAEVRLLKYHYINSSRSGVQLIIIPETTPNLKIITILRPLCVLR